MDTRSKIITPEEACALANGDRLVALVSGYFDVLLAASVRELTRVRDSLPEAIVLVAIGTPKQPVLEARARAEMVAALAVVDYVVYLEEEQLAQLACAFPCNRLFRLEAAHQQRMRELIEHVHRRQSQ
jgi:bifunctional ADP-heptose synthase (sugar kinase/adenylyltransferase)